jgi:hypothetical protein
MGVLQVGQFMIRHRPKALHIEGILGQANERLSSFAVHTADNFAFVLAN